jgi:hypothetical protein
MKKNEIDTPTLIVIMFIMMALINGLMACRGTKIASTPSKREINKAMKHSTWEYKMPKTTVVYDSYRVVSY